MIDRHRSDDSHFLSVLMRDLGHGFKAARTVDTHADPTVVGLLATGQRGSGGGGIGDQRIGRNRPGGRVTRKMIDQKLAVPDLTRKLLGHHPLWCGHAVADEQEDVLRIRVIGEQRTHHAKCK